MSSSLKAFRLVNKIVYLKFWLQVLCCFSEPFYGHKPSLFGNCLKTFARHKFHRPDLCFAKDCLCGFTLPSGYKLIVKLKLFSEEL